MNPGLPELPAAGGGYLTDGYGRKIFFRPDAPALHARGLALEISMVER